MQIRRFPQIPERIDRLEELAYNLKWSWDYRARLLFKRLDPDLWKNTQHNPVKLLHDIEPARLSAAARDPDFLRVYEVTMKALDRATRRGDKWFPRQFPDLAREPIAYFSAEFGLHTPLPIYSGGLGVLAGDHCKESSDLGIPLLGVGFVYPQGYFHQRIQADGWQEDIYELLERREAPIESAAPTHDERFLVELNVGSLRVFVVVWRVNLGSVPLYLMDTDVEENQQGDRELSARLYGGDKEHRVRQEIVLGVGGVRILRALGIQPTVFHANEGHTAFMLLERVREFVQRGQTFEEAAEQIRATSLLTTHTPVPAGHDAFPFHMMEKHFDRHLGPEWVDRHDDISFWNRVMDIPEEEIWNVHLLLKRKFLTFAREKARERWSLDRVDPRQVIAMGTLLDPDALTIGFARRFTGYKRAALIFHDLNRIRTMMLDQWRPVQIVFAGTGHPADEHGKHLIHQIYSLAADNGMAGHVAFVENYEMHAAHFFTQGVDVWLNNPRPPLEACGTSGQKAAMNGVLNVSMLDGWWYEGYNGNNGWAIGDPPEDLEVHYDDAADAESLYRLLEQQIIPLYYDRDKNDLPHGWIQMLKETIRSIVPRFSASRMVKEYASRMYVPASRQAVKVRS